MNIKSKQIILGLSLILMVFSAAADSDFENYKAALSQDYLSAQDRALMRKVAKNQQKNNLSLAGAQGEVIFAFGSSQPVIVCAVLELCDIKLQAGERINSVQIGDQVRWTVDAAVSGEGELASEHVIVKPLDGGIKTSLMIATNKRAYHLRLKSTADKFMPAVSFIYPEENLSKLNAGMRSRSDTQILRPKTKVNAGDLNFNYVISGDAAIRPERAFSDGERTFIEMPASFKGRELPVLVVLEPSSSWFGGQDEVMANYRIDGTRYIVDGEFTAIKLMLGTGRSAREALIRSKQAS